MEADYNTQCVHGTTALHYAAMYGHLEIAELLIKKGADYDAKSNFGTTALHFAAHNGHTEIAELLVENGANINAKDHRDSTVLDLANDEMKKVINSAIANRALMVYSAAFSSAPKESEAVIDFGTMSEYSEYYLSVSVLPQVLSFIGINLRESKNKDMKKTSRPTP